MSSCVRLATIPLAAFLAPVVCCVRCGAAAEKLLDTTLFASTSEHYRWSEGSILNLDGEKHLVMAVTAFGTGGHDHSAARILEFHSQDGGLTWTPLEEGRMLQGNVGKQTVANPSFLRLDNDELLCFVSVKNSIEDCGVWVKRSGDDGATWGELQRLPYEGYGGLGCDRALQISTGRVVVPCWVSMDALGSTHAYCFYSDDRGHTWGKTDLISTPRGSTGRKTDPAAEEPMVVELKDGRLMMVMRTYLKSIYRSFSGDGGATWGPPGSSGIPSPGSMATVKRLPTGDLLLIWNWARLSAIDGPWPRTFISAAISKDDGRNFTSVRHLDGAADFPGKITMANVTFANGNAVITYSKSMTRKNAYNWRLQVIPIQWFYEGDTSQVYGESYLPTLAAALEGRDSPAAQAIPRPTAAQRAAAAAKVSRPDGEEAGGAHLTAVYGFEEGGGEFAYDTSSGENDAWFRREGELPRWTTAEDGGAVEFGSGGGCLIAPHSERLGFGTGQFAVEATVFPTAVKKHCIIVTKEHVFEVGLLGGRLKAAVQAGGSWGPGWLGDTEVPLDAWSRIAVTFDARRLRFFVGGELVRTIDRPCRMDANEEPLVIGGCTHIPEPCFAGQIGEVRLWDSVPRHLGGEAVMDTDARQPRTIDATHQLFIDAELIGSIEGLARVVHQPVRCHDNPVLTYEKPWEGNCVITWGSVLYDEAATLFRVWYEVYKKYAEAGDQTLVCYATSRDGVSWDKPNLGLVDWRGSKDNNIVFAPAGGNIDAPTVLRDPRPDSGCRYRMYWHCGTDGGIRGATSDDGLRWDVLPGVLVAAGDRNSAWYDAGRGKFVVITRIPGRGLRTCGLWESGDGEHFEAVGEIAAPDDVDPDKTEFYGMIPFAYAGLRLGFLEVFHVPIRKLSTQLLYSRDGLEWQRACDRQVFLDWGPAGSWEQAWVTPSQNPPIRVGDRLFIFYQGRQTLHWAEPPFGHIGAIGLAFLRPDGFVSLEAQNAEGSVTTAPLVLGGDELHVNALARPGSVAVEILGSEGEALDGFPRADCTPVTGDSLDHAIRWRGGRTLAGLRDRPVRLRFCVQGAKLYSFWVE